MDSPELAHDGMTVVVLGEFDPLQIAPHWLRQMDLISAEDFESQHIEIISPGATVVGVGPVKLRVTNDSLQIAAESAADAEMTRDLAAGILLSKGSPTISAVGVNRLVHFGLPAEERHAIGDTLAPKGVWSGGVLLRPGMQNVAITGVRDDGYGGSVNVLVQPSNVIQPGVFISVNDHYNLTYAPMPKDRDTAADPEQGNPQRSPDKIPIGVEILTAAFGVSRARSQAVIDRVYSLRTA